MSVSVWFKTLLIHKGRNFSVLYIGMIATLYQLIRTNEAGLATCGYIIENEDGRPIFHINEVKSGKLTQWEAIHSLFNDRFMALDFLVT